MKYALSVILAMILLSVYSDVAFKEEPDIEYFLNLIKTCLVK